MVFHKSIFMFVYYENLIFYRMFVYYYAQIKNKIKVLHSVCLMYEISLIFNEYYRNFC